MVFEQKLSGAVRYGWVIVALGLTACADPSGRFDEFGARYTELNPNLEGVPCEERPCTLPAAGAMDGTYLWTVSAEVDPKKPVLFRADITTAASGAGLALTFAATALDAADRTSEVGTTTSYGPFEVSAAGCFVASLNIQAPGPANPITGTDLTADLVLEGQLCAGVPFVCGDVTGAVTAPANIPLEKSTFTFDPAASVGQYTEPPVLNCAGDEANPL